jgi:[protein-PII] uridylyltransferase
VTATERQARTDAADALSSAAFVRATGDPGAPGLALVAVGGYGRGELAPHSDLDLVLVHDEQTDPGEVAGGLWYPLWDAGVALDHAVRGLDQVTASARADVRVNLGLLDARHVAGDPAVTLRLRSALLADWRREARARVPQVRELVQRRVERLGELAHASVPDLKESGGGLRDTTVLKALVATWLVDVPHTELERSRLALLDVRDALHEVAGRGSDRVAPELWGPLAERLGLADAEAAQRHVRELGRRTTHIARLTWRRVDGVLTAPRRNSRQGRPGPALVPLGRGLAAAGGEVVLTRAADPAADPALLLRAAAESVERDLVLSPSTVARVLRESPSLPDPWPVEARELWVRLLAGGPALLSVWETLDETGALERILPEWERVRLLPHASPVHRFTVDRHVVETCIEAARLIRDVSRPDLLLVAALLHDIGKGGVQEHSVAGEPIAAEVARRWGLADADVDQVSRLVRWHLLLPQTATSRDLEDPRTVEHVVERLGGDPLTLELLAVLTEADARATAPQAWTTWRAGLVRELVARTGAALPGDRFIVDQVVVPELVVPPAVLSGSVAVDVDVAVTGRDGQLVTVVSRDRTGLLAAVSAVLAMQRASVRSARAWTVDDYAFSRWHVEATGLQPAALRERLEAVLAGRLDPAYRLRRRSDSPGRPHDGPGLDSTVAVRPEASRRATVLEVRTGDRAGVVHRVCDALSRIGIAVRSAHVSTFGPQAVDVFYLQEEAAGALGDERAAEAAHAVRRALTDPVTLDA